MLDPDGRLQHAGMILWRDATVSYVGNPTAPDAFGSVRAVDCCGSSSLLVRSAAWDLVGGLDERFHPVYYVDVDLAMSLRAQGFVVLFQPGSRIRHHRGASSTPRFREFLLNRNRHQFIEKWDAALYDHEPRVGRPSAATERAIARADAFGRARTRRQACGRPLPGAAPALRSDPPGAALSRVEPHDPERLRGPSFQTA